jgi:hypothetical protein
LTNANNYKCLVLQTKIKSSPTVKTFGKAYKIAIGVLFSGAFITNVKDAAYALCTEKAVARYWFPWSIVVSSAINTVSLYGLTPSKFRALVLAAPVFLFR